LIGRIKGWAKRHWPRLRLRTILLSTFIFVAALPGFGALFLRVYENTLVRQTEAELTAQGVAIAAAAASVWPGVGSSPATALAPADYRPERPAIDLRASPILSERPPPGAATAPLADALAVAPKISPVIRETTRTTLSSIILLDRRGQIVTGAPGPGSYAALPEVRAALAGKARTVLRRNADYHPLLPVEWLSRATGLRIHHARPIVAGGQVVGALLLSRTPPPLSRGLYADAGKIAFGFSAILATLVVLSGLLSRGIVRPIEALSAATRDLARGGGMVPDPPQTAAIEIQALYADFAEMAQAIEHRSRYLRDFAHAMSHEFKTPLAGITGAVELLQDHHAAMSDPERRRFLGNIAADSTRLAALVTRLLELARADMTSAGGDAVGDLGLALRRVADAYAGPALRIVLDVPDGVPPVAVPAATIEAVVASLIQNSREAGAGACTLRVTIERDEARLTVRDDGPGIPEANSERLFEPFFTTHRARGGTGLGLPIARSLLDAHRASIRLIECRGAVFELLLPLHKS
jgi:signal transduction histidine kinase